MLFRYLSASRLVTIAQIEGRVRGVGSEFVLACDMRFAALAVHLMTNTAVTGGHLRHRRPPAARRRIAKEACLSLCVTAQIGGKMEHVTYHKEIYHRRASSAAW